MLLTPRAPADTRAETRDALGTRRLVWGAAVLLVAAATAFRGWAVSGGWFLFDDYLLLHDAQRRPLTWDAVTEPYAAQLMPGGRLVAEWVASAGSLDWSAAAAFSVVMTGAAGLAAAWMLVTAFGPRPGVLGLLAVYLTTAMTLPATMWWAAALNQLPLQVSFFLAVGAWLHYLRDPRPRWLVLTLLALAFGLFFYVKTVLVGLVLGYVAVVYFSTGGPWTRVRQLWQRYRAGVVAGLVLGLGYTAAYLSTAVSPFASEGSGDLATTTRTALTETLPAGLLGGPWRWWDTTPPIVLADPPPWALGISWAVLTLLVAVTVLRRSGAVPGWALLGGYALLSAVLLGLTRGQLYGAFAGLEYRYLTDVACVATLAVGLALLPLPGALRSSTPRSEPLLRLEPGPWPAAALVTVVTLGGVVSSLGYVGYWHDENPVAAYVQEVEDELRARPGVDLAPQLLPDDVMPGYTEPVNQMQVFTDLLGADVEFPDLSDDLNMVDGWGRVQEVELRVWHRSRPAPDDGCGWRVDRGGRTLPLTTVAAGDRWWVRLGYVATRRSPVTLTAGDTTASTTVERGVHQLFLRVDGSFDEVRVDGLAPGTVLCLDTVQVGEPWPREEAP